MKLSSVTACLPSLRPILSLILYGDPNPSARGTKDNAPSRSWTRIQPSPAGQSHGQPTSVSDSQHSFSPLPDETFGFSGTKQPHGTSITSLGEPKINDGEDIEMQIGGRRAKSGIHVRSDVTVK